MSRITLSSARRLITDRHIYRLPSGDYAVRHFLLLNLVTYVSLREFGTWAEAVY